MTGPPDFSDAVLRPVRWSLRLTLWGMLAERVTRAFWPLWSVILAGLAALMMGLQDILPLELVWASAVCLVLGALWAIVIGVRRFRWPTRAAAIERVDRTLPGRPLTAVRDRQAVGAADPASQSVWRVHLERMAEQAEAARPVAPDLRLAARDPYALRYMALLAFAVAVLFGSVLRVATVAGVIPGAANALAAGPSWEGWIEPPSYTGKPSLYLNDIDRASFSVPEASRLTLRLYGNVGDLTVSETVSGRTGEVPSASASTQGFDVSQSGRLDINGPGGAGWNIDVIPDAPPQVDLVGETERGVSGEMHQRFRVRDDYGVLAGQAEIDLNLSAVDRRYGLAAAPEPRAPVVLDLPMTITGDKADFEETLIDDLSRHPWATLPVRLRLSAEDALGQTGQTEPKTITLPGRRFFDPLAAAIIEQRRDLLWNRKNGVRVAQVLRAVSNHPEDIFRSQTAYLKLRVALRRLELFDTYGLTVAQRDEIAQVLWDVAVMIEDGNLSGAAERLRQARERLADAIRNGATDQEIAKLMQDLREALQDYMRQLAQQQQQNSQDQAQNQQNMQQITNDQLQQLLNRLQELMEQGRTEEAQQLLDRLAQMMENMRVTQGRPGEQGPGEQAMKGLTDTLRQQQGLSDETFGDLQEQFNQNDNGPGEQGRAPGQQGQQGELPGQQGQRGPGQQQGQGEGQGRNGVPGQGDRPGQSQMGLADRQRALRDELDRQSRNLPGTGTAEGDAAREALGRAGRAMDQAEDALRQDDLAGALDNQAQAIEALREGLRNLDQALAQQQQQRGQQGDATGRASRNQQRDPLGRDPGANGRIGTDQKLLQGDDVYRRARELLDEIRRRSGNQSRPDQELNYLRRLLNRF